MRANGTWRILEQLAAVIGIVGALAALGLVGYSASLGVQLVRHGG